MCFGVRRAFMASCSSSVLRWPSRPSPSTWPRKALQHFENALLIGQGCTGLARCSAGRTHCVTCAGRRTSSPIRPNLSFRHTQGCLQAAGPPDSTATQSNARAPCALAFVPRGGRGDRNGAERCADSSARRPRLGSRRPRRPNNPRRARALRRSRAQHIGFRGARCRVAALSPDKPKCRLLSPCVAS